MTTWPDTLNVAPIREWPGVLSRTRRYAPFRANLAATLDLLDREIRELTDTRTQRDSAELLVAIPAGVLWRQDGRGFAQHRGIAVTQQLTDAYFAQIGAAA